MYQATVNDELLAEVVRRLVEAIDPDKIILFGSRARGDARHNSDLDLLIVKASDEGRHRRDARAYEAVGVLGVPKDILWYTPEEVEDWSAVRYHVATRAVKEGRILYEKQPGLCPADRQAHQLGTRKVNGLPVLEAPDDFPVITTERVRELLDQE